MYLPTSAKSENIYVAEVATTTHTHILHIHKVHEHETCQGSVRSAQHLKPNTEKASLAKTTRNHESISISE